MTFTGYELNRISLAVIQYGETYNTLDKGWRSVPHDVPEDSPQGRRRARCWEFVDKLDEYMALTESDRELIQSAFMNLANQNYDMIRESIRYNQVIDLGFELAAR